MLTPVKPMILSTLLSPASSPLVVKNEFLLKGDQISLTVFSGQFFQTRFWVTNVIFVSFSTQKKKMSTATWSHNLIFLPPKSRNPSIVFQIRVCLPPPNEHRIELHLDLIHCLGFLLQQRSLSGLNRVLVKTRTCAVLKTYMAIPASLPRQPCKLVGYRIDSEDRPASIHWGFTDEEDGGKCEGSNLGCWGKEAASHVI